MTVTDKQVEAAALRRITALGEKNIAKAREIARAALTAAQRPPELER